MFVALLSSLSFANPPAAGGGGGGGGGLMEAFKENPTFLSINLVVSAVVVALIVERAAFQLGKYRVNSKEFFAHIETLVGLLGTVLGLIHTFQAVGNPGYTAAQRQAILAAGIAEAMYNTA